MSIRLVVTISAVPGRGSDLAEAYKSRCAEAMKEPGNSTRPALRPELRAGAGEREDDEDNRTR